MTQLDVISPGAFASLSVKLDPGERFMSEAGLMVRADASIDIDVTTRTRGKGGVLSGLKRMLAGDSFFLSTYTAEQTPGEVVLAPILPGDVFVVDLDGSTSWLCAGASYMASGPDVELDTQFQGLMRGMFSGESMFFLQASGSGPLAVAAFGRIREIEIAPGSSFVVDTGHVVAFTEGLEYELTKAGSSWISSWLAGEGFVLRFSGAGKLLVQSHNPVEFGRSIGPQLPER